MSARAGSEGMGTDESQQQGTLGGKFHHQNKEVVATCTSFSAFQTYCELMLFGSLTKILTKKEYSFLLVLVVNKLLKLV